MNSEVTEAILRLTQAIHGIILSSQEALHWAVTSTTTLIPAHHMSALQSVQLNTNSVDLSTRALILTSRSFKHQLLPIVVTTIAQPVVSLPI